VEEFNQQFSLGDCGEHGNSSHEDDSCIMAKHRFPCSSCLLQLPPSQRPPYLTIQPLSLQATGQMPHSPPTSHSQTDTLGPETFLYDGPKLPWWPKLTKHMASLAASAINDFCKDTWTLKEGSTHCWLPWMAFLPFSLKQQLWLSFILFGIMKSLLECLSIGNTLK